MKYDVIIIGAGPGGIFSAYELIHQNKDLKIAVFEEGYSLEKRHCPIDGKKVPSSYQMIDLRDHEWFRSVPVLFLMENTISQTTLAVLYLNISAKKKHWI